MLTSVSDYGTLSVTITRIEGWTGLRYMFLNSLKYLTDRFAYGRADVVLMCFDTGRMVSLEHCRSDREKRM